LKFLLVRPLQSTPRRCKDVIVASDHCQSNTLTHTPDTNPLDEGLTRRRNAYLYNTKKNTHKRQISMPSTGFKPATTANETYASGRAATGTGSVY